jgi:hypothetical protein
VGGGAVIVCGKNEYPMSHKVCLIWGVILREYQHGVAVCNWIITR